MNLDFRPDETEPESPNYPGQDEAEIADARRRASETLERAALEAVDPHPYKPDWKDGVGFDAEGDYFEPGYMDDDYDDYDFDDYDFDDYDEDLYDAAYDHGWNDGWNEAVREMSLSTRIRRWFNRRFAPVLTRFRFWRHKHDPRYRDIPF